MSVSRVLTHDRLCRAMTGCTPPEFRALVPEFARQLGSRAWDAYRANPHRQRAPGGGRKLFAPTPEEQLCFLLVYFRTYPTFDVLGLLYDRDRSRPCVADVFRSKREGADDHAMIIACGLWNYHLASTS